MTDTERATNKRIALRREVFYAKQNYYTGKGYDEGRASLMAMRDADIAVPVPTMNREEGEK